MHLCKYIFLHDASIIRIIPSFHKYLISLKRNYYQKYYYQCRFWTATFYFLFTSRTLPHTYSYPFFPCGILHPLQSFIPFLVYEKFPPQSSPKKYRGQKQNRQLNSSVCSVLWHGKYSQFLWLKKEYSFRFTVSSFISISNFMHQNLHGMSFHHR